MAVLALSSQQQTIPRFHHYNLWVQEGSKCLVQAKEREKVYYRDKSRWVNYGPFNISGPYSFEMWTFYFKIVYLYFLRVVRPNPPRYGPAFTLHSHKPSSLMPCFKSNSNNFATKFIQNPQ